MLMMINDDIKVTVYCLTYNHEEYIKDTLEGFISQKTSFRYQVIIHDDASTDGTQRIIKKYCQSYPHLLIPILQTENQYSKNVQIFSAFIAPIVKGKYITVCEGDDYWCDTEKLQKQFDIMENNPQYIACVHNTLMINCINNKRKVMFPTGGNRILKATDVISAGGSTFHTSSLFYRKEYMYIPENFIIPKSGDYSRAIYLALNGDIFYMSDVMSVYRFNVKGSWSARQNKESIIERLHRVIEVLNYADAYSNYRYHEEIKEIIRKKQYLIYMEQGNYAGLIKEYPDIICNENRFIDRAKLYIKAYISIIIGVLGI